MDQLRHMWLVCLLVLTWDRGRTFPVLEDKNTEVLLLTSNPQGIGAHSLPSRGGGSCIAWGDFALEAEGLLLSEKSQARLCRHYPVWYSG